jgi:hypothetical protein
MKKSVIALMCLALLFAMPLASAGFWQWLTGQVTENPTDVNVSVVNTPPVVSGTAIVPSSPKKANTLNCSAVVTDHDMDTLSMNFTWLNGSTPFSSHVYTGLSNGTMESFLLTPATQSKGETWYCKVFANDGINDSNLGSADVTVGNTAPTITNVYFQDNVAPLEASSRSIVVNFTAQDDDGYPDLASTTFQLSGTRVGSCSAIAGASGDSQSYTCSVTMWYFDPAQGYTITVSVTDTSAATATNNSYTYNYGSTSAFVMSPSVLTWPPVTPGQSGVESDNDPTLMNNTGNFPFTAIKINATDLKGATDPTKIIPGSVFKSAGATPCSGTSLVSSDYATIGVLGLGIGNNSAGGGQQNLYYCLNVPSAVTRQAYTTTAMGAWTVKVA